MKKTEAYQILIPEVQRIIPKKWDQLRYIQEKTILQILDPKLNTKRDLIISAPTSSGKTEAAFLPTVSSTYREIRESIKILYISPLIALINDQEIRLNQLLNENQDKKIKITKWHSEVSKSYKENFCRNPKGILIITPESLESLLIRGKEQSLFEKVEYYIIDEFHDFLGGVRGDQLRSILKRLDNINYNNPPRKILLSATLNGVESCKKWLDKEDVIEIKPDNIVKKPKVNRKITYFKNLSNYYDALLKNTEKGKHLVFGNSKRGLEFACHQFSKQNKNMNIEIHHGSLSKESKNEVEKKLKKEKDIVVFCTSTLEMGIDISDIKRVCLIESPFSASSFVQRIGRSGRKEGSNIDFCIFPDIASRPPCFYPELNIKFIQAIALVELHKEKWVEPKEFQTYTYSVCVHQILSFISQEQKVKKDELWNKIVYPNFSQKGIKVSEKDFNEIIDELINKNILNSDQSNYLSVSEEGEELTQSKDFCSVFKTEKCWELKTEKDEKFIGEISRKQKLEEEDNILFSGKCWAVKQVKPTKNVIYLEENVEESPKLPLFISKGGCIHKKVHQKMLEIYTNRNSFDYLDEESDAQSALNKAREEFDRISNKDPHFIPMFIGSGVTNFINFLLMRQLDIKSYIISSGIGLHSKKIDKIRLQDILKKKFSSRDAVEDIVKNLGREALELEKYDHLLPTSILQKSYINYVLCFNDYLEYINKTDNALSKDVA